MKTTLGDLKRLIREALDSDVPESDTTKDSLDSQIDSYLIDFEKDAKSNDGPDARSRQQQEGFDLRSFLLAEDDDKKDDAGNEPTQTPKQTNTDLNVENFVNGVVRLVENYDSMLEVKNTILRRAEIFLDKQYDSETIESFKTALKDNHGLVIGQSKEESDAENFQAPAADRAGPSSGGGAG